MAIPDFQNFPDFVFPEILKVSAENSGNFGKCKYKNIQ